MLSEKMQGALNKQINAELYSAYLYLSMAAYCDSKGLPGFAHWMQCQAKEEQMHATKLYKHVQERGGRVTLSAIEAPQGEWSSPAAMFEHVYQHEQKVTGLINDLVNLAIEEKDHASNNFLQWFVGEQVEEEASASEVLGKLKLVKDDGRGLLMLDRELATRLPLFNVIPPVGGE